LHTSGFTDEVRKKAEEERIVLVELADLFSE